MLSVEDLRGLPKVALHDHLDGGLRPETVIEHCTENGHDLPTTNPDELRRWFFEAADSGTLVRYLETFEHTVAAMQTAAQIRRVAHEFAVDQALDGVVYAEARYAPEQHLGRGLTLREVVEAVRDGLDSGMAEAEATGHAIVVQQIVTSMRHGDPTLEIARLAVEYRDQGVCGFDIAGAEDGFPPARFREAFDFLRSECVFYTVHAGEAAGPESMHEAIAVCGANRIGHGVRIIEDITRDERGKVKLGRLASYVRDAQIPLEVAPSSNLQTGIADSIAEHPVALLWSLGFNVTINCDNRLQSGTTMSREFGRLVSDLGWGIDDVERATTNAMAAAFLPHDQRLALIHGIIKPSYTAFRAGWDS
ncbi:adenosine deaminase [Tessaracoccus sp. OS52]|uniref:adenosine deaminase n=1 Tax=Tessaracoccus sp. OS52 TaxID=2886691 RepID=UPI001D12641F|nr:adenosine deaminase [Tessaracoccus sp. OS52]MCC2592322.1 adenosine deaminase [Tessaracoccus sp. OS52]